MTRKDKLKDPPDKLTGPEEDRREAVKYGVREKDHLNEKASTTNKFEMHP
jgi:hypothetical protein